MSQKILFETTNHIATITLNRPEVKNALTGAMCNELADIIKALKDDDSIRVLVIKANGSDFCVGADLKELSCELPRSPVERGRLLGDKVRGSAWPIFLGLHELSLPIIASVRGHTIGAGAQMLLSADLCIASNTTRVLMPQANLAHPVDHGESYYLPRKVGLAKAMELTLLAEPISGEEAARIGLVNWCVADKTLEQKTQQVARKLASAAPLAIREIKSLLLQSQQNSIYQQYTCEAEALSRCASSNDFLEAISAFTEKRKPDFKGC